MLLEAAGSDEATGEGVKEKEAPEEAEEVADGRDVVEEESGEPEAGGLELALLVGGVVDADAAAAAGVATGADTGTGAEPSAAAAASGSMEPRRRVMRPCGKPSDAISAAAVCRSPVLVGVPVPDGVLLPGVEDLAGDEYELYNTSPGPEPSLEESGSGVAGLAGGEEPPAAPPMMNDGAHTTVGAGAGDEAERFASPAAGTKGVARKLG